MATDRAPSRPWLLAISTALLLGCGGGADATATERLWVSGVPTNPKERLTAFITTRTGNDKYLGAFFNGSLYRGGHDVFEWVADGKDSAHLKFMQDGRAVKLRIEKCEPSRGFDHCIRLKGDPMGIERYQSRKRWVVRRPGKKRDIAEGLVTQTILDLAEDDEDLRALTEL
jgi:hypothetical protein